LSPLYEENGVLCDGFAAALQDCCPSAERCWARAADRRQPTFRAEHGFGENGSVFWPFIGDQYDEGGLCVVSLNLNNARGKSWAGLPEEYRIAQRVLARWAEGKKTVWHRSAFHWRLVASAHAVLASLDGAEPVSAPTLEQTTAALHRLARIQAVKCAPRHGRSYPTSSMRRECPGRFATHELDVLSPSAIVAMGKDAAEAVRRVATVELRESAPVYSRGVMWRGDRTIDVFFLPHPSARGSLWRRGQDAHVTSLRASPCRPNSASRH
jgi:hypothetical protein